MEIKKNYDYLSNPNDIYLTASTRANLILRGRINYIILCLVFVSFCFILAINAQSNFLYFCGLMVLLFGIQNIYKVYYVRKKLGEIKTSVEETAVKVGIVTITFDDKMFTYRDNQQYIEYQWENFSSILINNGFLFLIISNNITSAICLNTKHFTESEFNALMNFLKARLPSYKTGLFR
jgi:hypothetical protein